MRLDRIMVEHVDTPPRLRAVDSDRVQRLAESIGAIGLQTPITVWAKPDDAFQLVAGAHRLEAARSLGLEFIDAFFMDANEIDRQLWEIDENLMRSELTPTQQAEHLAKRKELWEARTNSGTTCPENSGRGRPAEFASETASATGVDKRTVNRAISRAKGVTEEARDAIRGTDLDKGTVLDDLKRVEPSRQMDRLREIQKERETSTRNKIDMDVKARAAKEIAETIAEHVPAEWWDGVKANLYAAGATNIAHELSNIIGTSIMDRRFG